MLQIIIAPLPQRTPTHASRPYWLKPTAGAMGVARLHVPLLWNSPLVQQGRQSLAGPRHGHGAGPGQPGAWESDDYEPACAFVSAKLSVRPGNTQPRRLYGVVCFQYGSRIPEAHYGEKSYQDSAVAACNRKRRARQRHGLAQVRENMRHSNIGTTSRYLHLLDAG